jgi:predicted transcriptional regulator of viral defense system
MGRRYLTINVSEEQQQFIRLLDEFEIDIFSIEKIERQLNKEFKNLNAILENLVDKQFISRIEKGKYCKANFRDEFVIGTFIAKEGVIAYWTALNKHGLTEQFSNTIFVQTPFLKRDKTVFGIRYKFVKIARSKRDGIEQEGYGNRTFWITDKEKTIVDCFDLPEYSGGYAELIRAFNEASLDNEKLIRYCKAVNNIAVIKRIGLLAVILKRNELNRFIEFAKTQVNKRYSLLDPLGSNKGEFVNEWRVRMNISRNQIAEITNKQY